MHVVRHHHLRPEFIELPLVVAGPDGTRHNVGNGGMPEPGRSNAVPIEGAILRHEGVAGGGVHGGIRFGRQ